MRSINRNKLKRLLQPQSGPCVSIFMPTHRTRPDKQREDRLRLKNLIREAELQLEAYRPDLTVPERKQLLEPAAKLLEDGLFWKRQDVGLALFMSSNASHVYRLPVDFKDRVQVADRFHIRPLLSLLAGNGRFYLLALSQNELRCFECTRHTISEMDLDQIPTSLAQAIADDDPERQLQFHTSTGAFVATGNRAAIFHGQAVEDDQKTNILRYFRKIDAGLQETLRAESAPLVLAGVDYLFSIYQEANTYPYLLDSGIPGNPESVPAETLLRQAWQIVRPHFLRAQREAVRRYGHLANTERATDDLTVIVDAACTGRVDILFVSTEAHSPDQEDKADLAAGQTLLNGGDVYCVAPDAIPGEAAVAAIFRY